MVQNIFTEIRRRAQTEMFCNVSHFSGLTETIQENGCIILCPAAGRNELKSFFKSIS